MLDGFEKLAEGTGKVLETVPGLYDDALKPATKESGKFLARIPRAINAVFADLDKWILNKEFSVEETKKLLNYKLQNISPNKIVTPEPYVAIPAIQAISYSMNSEELRNLYANLLANSMNIDTKDFVHPAFVEIIKQLSPADAQVLNKISSDNFLPSATLVASEYANSTTNAINAHYVDPFESPIKKYEISNLTSIQFLNYKSAALSIDNLIRQRLIEVRYNFDEGIHDSIINSPIYTQCKNELEKHIVSSNWRYEETPSSLWFTNLGRSFNEICIKNIN